VAERARVGALLSDEAPPRFGWHPDHELIDVLEPGSRPALERLGADAWSTLLDYLYEHGLVRSMGEPSGHDALRALFPSRPAPAGPTPAADLLGEFRERLAPHQLNAWHPRTLSYFTPPPLWMSIVGELLAQVTQQGVDVWHAGPSAAFIEEEAIGWLLDLVGFGDGSFGLLTSGGVMANFIALALARGERRGSALEGLRVYASDQAHFSITRSLVELGFPDETLHLVESDARFRLRADTVADAIRSDRSVGLQPLAIAAVAGSTSTGSVDLVGELADLAEREGLWLHVDAAYGGAARLSARDSVRMPDLERADSVTIDPHKWFFQAYDVGAILVRDGSLLGRVFAHDPEYYRGGGQGGGLDFYRLGFEGTRRWRALKLWLSWRHLGTDGLGRLVEHTIDLTAALADRLRASAAFELAVDPPELSVVCFRHLPDGLTDGEALDQHQDRLQRALEASGDGWLSTTRLRGRTWLRAGIVNYLTRESDLDRLLETLRGLGAP
jgi:aromatic-L-amino-acid decarboxylase